CEYGGTEGPMSGGAVGLVGDTPAPGFPAVCWASSVCAVVDLCAAWDVAYPHVVTTLDMSSLLSGSPCRPDSGLTRPWATVHLAQFRATSLRTLPVGCVR